MKKIIIKLDDESILKLMDTGELEVVLTAVPAPFVDRDLTTVEVAKELGCKVLDVQYFRDSKKLPCYQPKPKVNRYKLSDVLKLKETLNPVVSDNE